MIVNHVDTVPVYQVELKDRKEGSFFFAKYVEWISHTRSVMIVVRIGTESCLE